MQGHAKSVLAPRTRETISFGPFSLVASERLLTKDGAWYITTLAGRGYCFVAPVVRANEHDPEVGAVAVSFAHANLPACLTRMVGRDEDVLKVSTQLTAT